MDNAPLVLAREHFLERRVLACARAPLSTLCSVHCGAPRASTLLLRRTQRRRANAHAGALGTCTCPRTCACASEWPFVFIRVCASLCAASASLCSASRRAAPWTTISVHAYTLCFSHTGHAPLSAARRFVRNTQNIIILIIIDFR